MQANTIANPLAAQLITRVGEHDIASLRNRALDSILTHITQQSAVVNEAVLNAIKSDEHFADHPDIKLHLDEPIIGEPTLSLLIEKREQASISLQSSHDKQLEIMDLRDRIESKLRPAEAAMIDPNQLLLRIDFLVMALDATQRVANSGKMDMPLSEIRANIEQSVTACLSDKNFLHDLYNRVAVAISRGDITEETVRFACRAEARAETPYPTHQKTIYHLSFATQGEKNLISIMRNKSLEEELLKLNESAKNYDALAAAYFKATHTQPGTQPVSAEEIEEINDLTVELQAAHALAPYRQERALKLAAGRKTV